MKAHVRCFSILRDIAGAPVLELELPADATVGSILKILRRQPYQSLGDFISNENGELKPYVKLVRNGELQTPSTGNPVSEGDEFHLFVATSGG